jgi:hypothetical protein
MELINHTPLPARLDMARFDGVDFRVGLVSAKATFRIDRGRALLDDQQPLGVLVADQATELGTLPRDLLPRRDRRFEVMLLGHARAPAGQAVPSADVRLKVGSAQRAMRIFGDRRWQDGVASEPEPFERMPLTWERAFGGRCPVEIDDGAFLELREQNNPSGRGFDVAAQAQIHADALRVPDGYPRFDDPGLLPNLEDPAALIGDRGDAPEPICWAPLPADSALRVKWQLDRLANGDPEDFEPLVSPFSAEEVVNHSFLNAHPDWLIDRPSAGAEVVMEGLSPDGALRFELPAIDVRVDSAIAERRGSIALGAQSLVLLPDEQRFYLVFRGAFRTDYQPNEERALRLRVEEGWV